MFKLKRLFILSAGVILISHSSSGAEPYERILKHPKCELTSIAEIGSRLGQDINGKFVPADPKEVGTSIAYTNGIYGVSYDYVPAISKRSRVADPVRLCLISQYVQCPKGDDRGKTYRAINLRTKEIWSLPDAQHICGGA
jgi:hypothetical protein